MNKSIFWLVIGSLKLTTGLVYLFFRNIYNSHSYVNNKKCEKWVVERVTINHELEEDRK